MESGARANKYELSELPEHIRVPLEANPMFAPLGQITVDVHLDVPLADGSTTESILLIGGDAASANALCSKVAPNDRGNPCDLCTAPKRKFHDDEFCRKAPRLNYATGMVLSHLNPLSKARLGKRNRELQCDSVQCPAPGCGKWINDESERADADEWAAAGVAKRQRLRRTHINTHFGATRGQEYWVVHDNRRHARSSLHLRTNGFGNNLAATLDAVPYTKLPTRRSAGSA